MNVLNLAKGSIVATALLLSTFDLQAESMFVQPAKTSLRQDAQPSAPALSELNRGTEVEVLEKKGMWFQVRVSGKQGFVSRLALAGTRPVGQAELLSSLKTVSDEKLSRKREQPAQTAASARGLQEDQFVSDRKRGNQQRFNIDLQAVESLDKLQINSGQLDNFTRSANLSSW